MKDDNDKTFQNHFLYDDWCLFQKHGNKYLIGLLNIHNVLITFISDL